MAYRTTSALRQRAEEQASTSPGRPVPMAPSTQMPSPEAAAVPPWDGKPPAPDWRGELARAAAALEAAIAERDLSIFYRVFRASDLANLPAAYGANPRGLHRACFDVLRR